MEGLSKQQQKVYDFIEGYWNENRIGPTIADISDGVGLATSTVYTYIEALRKKGRVTSEEGVHRSLQVVSAA